MPQIIEIKDMAIDLQNENWHNIKGDLLVKFQEEVDILKGVLLTEIAKVSKTTADRYNKYGTVDTAPFMGIIGGHQRMLLGYIRQTWQIANELADKYA